MAATTTLQNIPVDGEQLASTLLAPEAKPPGVLFVHGWGGSQESDLVRAHRVAGLGCLCLTFDMRGHGEAIARQRRVTREENLRDLLAAYDYLVRQPDVDPSAIAVIGNSYGAYLSAILTTLRSVRWLSLTVPALYLDEDWRVPKIELDREELARYRRTRVTPAKNRALAACAQFQGDVLLIEAERDHLVPHETLMSYRDAFEHVHSLTHRIVDGADHSMSGERCQRAFTSILMGWVAEMIIGRRTGAPATDADRGAV